MTAWLMLWWVWIALALLLGIVEILLPSFLFLGFALGALAVGVSLAVSPWLLGGLSVGALVAVFAGLSLAAWLVLRAVFRGQTSSSKIFTKDIND